MEYVYAALLLHKAGKKLTEENVNKVLTAAGVKVDESRVKALVAALEGVNIEDAIGQAAPVAAAAPSSAGGAPPEAGEKEEKKEEVSEEEAASGLGSLFG